MYEVKDHNKEYPNEKRQNWNLSSIRNDDYEKENRIAKS